MKSVVPAALQFADIHGSNEHLSLDNLNTMLRFYRQLIINVDTPTALSPIGRQP